jgi:hypothetical protein
MIADDRPSVLRGSDWASSLVVEVEVEVCRCPRADAEGIGRRVGWRDGVPHVMR